MARLLSLSRRARWLRKMRTDVLAISEEAQGPPPCDSKIMPSSRVGTEATRKRRGARYSKRGDQPLVHTKRLQPCPRVCVTGNGRDSNGNGRDADDVSKWREGGRLTFWATNEAVSAGMSSKGLTDIELLPSCSRPRCLTRRADEAGASILELPSSRALVVHDAVRMQVARLDCGL